MKLIGNFTAAISIGLMAAVALISAMLTSSFYEITNVIHDSLATWRVDVVAAFICASLIGVLTLPRGKHSASRVFWKTLTRIQVMSRRLLQDNGMIAAN